MYITDYDIILNLFLCVIDMFVITELRERIYGRIAHFRRLCLALSVALSSATALLPGFYGSTFFVLPISLLLLPFYPKNLKKKFLFEICLLSLTFSYMMALNDITNSLPRFSHWGMTYIAIFHFGLWALLFLCLRLCRNVDTELPMSLWVIFLLIPLATAVSSALLIPMLSENSMARPEADLIHLVIQATFLFIDIALLEFLRRFTGYFQKEKEQNLLAQQLQYQEKYYRQLIDSSEQIQKARHDMKNHLQAISLLYEENKTEELSEYLKHVSDRIGRSERVVSTGNPGFDAVLNIKLSEMSEKGISCTPVLSIPAGLMLPFSDSVTILGNLLDNAISSCERAASQRNAVMPLPLSVGLSVTCQSGSLFVHMVNPCMETVKAPYGIGMRNVEETVERYSGTMRTEIKDKTYITDIILYEL